MFLPKIICSSVVRTSKPGDSHGGIFLVDLEKGTHKEVFNWANRQISWEGRGGDRGLRGICFYEQYVICAASNELMFFNHDFEIVERYSNPYLKSCHEIFIEGKTMYLSSTGFDAILTFDLESKTFRDGYCFRKRWPKNSFWRAIRKHRLLPVIWRYVFYTFSCNGTKGPSAKDTTHINNVFARNGRIYFSGTEVNSLFEIGLNKKVKSFRNIHKGTHNVSLFGDFCIYNNTKNDCITAVPLSKDSGLEPYDLHHPPAHATGTHEFSQDHARSNFARGLCFQGDLLICGCSPSTIHVFSMAERRLIKSVVLSTDVRNAIHGLELLPDVFSEV